MISQHVIPIPVFSPLSLPTSETSNKAWYRDLRVSHRSYQAPHGSQLQPSHNVSLLKCRLCFQQSKRIRPDRASKCSPFPQFKTPVVLRRDGKIILPSLPSALHSLNPFLCYDSQAERDFPPSSIITSLHCRGKWGLGAWSPS